MFWQRIAAVTRASGPMSLLCLRDVAENLPHASKSHICVTTQGLSLIDETEQVSSNGVSLRF